jgi:hypothetical protein
MEEEETKKQLLADHANERERGQTKREAKSYGGDSLSWDIFSQGSV